MQFANNVQRQWNEFIVGGIITSVENKKGIPGKDNQDETDTRKEQGKEEEGKSWLPENYDTKSIGPAIKQSPDRQLGSSVVRPTRRTPAAGQLKKIKSPVVN